MNNESTNSRYTTEEAALIIGCPIVFLQDLCRGGKKAIYRPHEITSTKVGYKWSFKDLLIASILYHRSISSGGGVRSVYSQLIKSLEAIPEVFGRLDPVFDPLQPALGRSELDKKHIWREYNPFPKMGEGVLTAPLVVKIGVQFFSFPKNQKELFARSILSFVKARADFKYGDFDHENRSGTFTQYPHYFSVDLKSKHLTEDESLRKKCIDRSFEEGQLDSFVVDQSETNITKLNFLIQKNLGILGLYQYTKPTKKMGKVEFMKS